MSTAEQTTTVGYYNGNDYALHLVISKYNVTLYLQPGEYLKDKQGRKINDPFFDRYRQLSKEVSETPVIMVRVPEPGGAKPLPHDGQSVRSVTEFTHSPAGVRVPVIPQPRILKAQEINKNSVIPMTMEEARRRGLAHRTREVPEDYGVTDTDSAMPPRRPPPMKFATDLTPTKAAPLPKELLEAAKEDGQAKSPALVAQLAQQANVEMPEPELNSGFANKVVQHHAPPNSPITAGPAETDAGEEEAPLPPPKRTPRPAVPQPPPVVEALPEPVGVDEPPVEEEVEAQPKPVTQANKCVCSVCGAGFKFPSELARHAAAKHRAQYNAIMANYPIEER